MMTFEEQKAALWDIVTNYIDEHKISCGEAIAQNDDVITNAYTFIYDLCEVVGYYQYPEDE